MLAQLGQALVELGAQFAHLAGVVGQGLLAPAVVDRLEQGQQGGGGGQDDLALAGVFDERRVLLQGGAEEGFAGQEQHHELRRVRELVPVGLLGKLLDVGAHVLGEALQSPAPGPIVQGLGGLQEGRHRGLGIQHQGLAAGQAHQHVRALAVRRHLLLVEVAVVLHARHLHHPLQLHLAPAAAHLGPAQGVHQAAGLAAQVLLGGEQALHLLGELAVALGPGLFQGLGLAGKLGQFLGQGLHQPFHRLLAGGQVALRGFLEHLQVLGGEVQEGLVVAGQGLGGEGVEGVGELLLGGPQQGLLLLGAATLLLQPGGQAFRFSLQAGHLGEPAPALPEQQQQARRQSRQCPQQIFHAASFANAGHDNRAAARGGDAKTAAMGRRFPDAPKLSG